MVTPITQNPTATGQPAPATSAPASPSNVVITVPPNSGVKPTPCGISNGPEVYLIIEGKRRHIVDWTTFENLGYKAADIGSCGSNASLPEGAPITRLFKGSGDAVYHMELGYRHHIPDMTTFTANGFRVEDITILPDAILNLWPLGVELTPVTASNGVLFKTLTIGAYTIRLFHPTQGMFDFATINVDGQPEIVVQDVESIADLPAADITGEGNPDVVFLIRGVGSAHCCWGTAIYDLGASAVNVLRITSPAYFGMNTGRGELKDLNGDGIYEFVTYDPMPMGTCSSGTAVMTVLRYDASQQKYVGASPQFASYFDTYIADLTASTQPTPACLPLVAALLYIGKTDEARSEFDRLYTGTDPDMYWEDMKSTVEHGRYYVPAQ
jgi:hypothetical protein